MTEKRGGSINDIRVGRRGKLHGAKKPPLSTDGERSGVSKGDRSESADSPIIPETEHVFAKPTKG